MYTYLVGAIFLRLEGKCIVEVFRIFGVDGKGKSLSHIAPTNDFRFDIRDSKLCY